mmetsp:Transcript_603/g.1093  ORF Transcript_603/g.1093 Transcript_603/m.1093 type:complete len:396 (+) Transcript_603:161-1348(+)|eukprot:CAMPEP_0176493270 /NCGR_PEP_ID=MMETSP0200_2-20121128/9462_1 /TAXON_ID=947934 /ORGANISM="Chaetoceros sp., Strain GSL56" /LENGTH=395 /DNA_ID=CAMNT_0017890927 /DNA_START=137 /DNA_END=1324 /DNA_ORIENTATION=+
MSSSIESTAPSSWTTTICRVMLRVGSVGVGMVAIVAGILYAKQESLLYFPEIGGIPRRPSSNPRRYRSPSEYSIPFETHMIRCEDGVSIHSWLLLHPNSKAQRKPTIVFFHGNAGNIGLRLPNAHQMYTQLDANVLMVEYRGYGDSDSVKPTEGGLKLDAEAALEFITSHPQVDSQRIFCFGRSLGGAVAFHLAKYAEKYHKPLAGIMVENTFLSIGTMVDQLMPLIAPLKFFVLRMDWGNDKIAPFIRIPVLYLAGDSDELVPHNHMTKLFEYSSKSSHYTKMHIIKGGTHNDSWMVGGSEYFEKMRSFISHVILNESDHNFDGNEDSTASLDLPGRVSTDSDSVEVTMGQEGMTSMKIGRNSIPIMPKNFLGIAKEATKLSKKESVGPDKKES